LVLPFHEKRFENQKTVILSEAKNLLSLALILNRTTAIGYRLSAIGQTVWPTAESRQLIAHTRAHSQCNHQ
jgi:hypothetical protein